MLNHKKTFFDIKAAMRPFAISTAAICYTLTHMMNFFITFKKFLKKIPIPHFKTFLYIG